MWIKVLGTILLGVMALAFLSDLYVIDTVYSKAGRSMEHALDAGIVKTTVSDDAQKGTIRVNAELTAATRQAFRTNMDLDGDLENNILKNSQFELRPHYHGEVPIIEVEFHTNVSFSLPFIQYPITVKRQIDYQSIYI